jgi:hypothetical protein
MNGGARLFAEAADSLSLREVRELDEEMAFHRGEAAKQFEAEGMMQEEARYAASRQSGNITRMLSFVASCCSSFRNRRALVSWRECLLPFVGL